MKTVILTDEIYNIPNTLYLELRTRDVLYRDYADRDLISKEDKLLYENRRIDLEKIWNKIRKEYRSKFIDAHFAI